LANSAEAFKVASLGVVDVSLYRCYDCARLLRQKINPRRSDAGGGVNHNALVYDSVEEIEQRWSNASAAWIHLDLLCSNLALKEERTTRDLSTRRPGPFLPSVVYDCPNGLKPATLVGDHCTAKRVTQSLLTVFLPESRHIHAQRLICKLQRVPLAGTVTKRASRIQPCRA